MPVLPPWLPCLLDIVSLTHMCSALLVCGLSTACLPISLCDKPHLPSCCPQLSAVAAGAGSIVLFLAALSMGEQVGGGLPWLLHGGSGWVGLPYS